MREFLQRLRQGTFGSPASYPNPQPISFQGVQGGVQEGSLSTGGGSGASAPIEAIPQSVGLVPIQQQFAQYAALSNFSAGINSNGSSASFPGTVFLQDVNTGTQAGVP
jgi:hypothetical protein